MKRDFSSWLLGVIIIGVAALIVVAFVRYFRYRTIAVEELSKKDEIVEKFGDALAKPPSEDLDQTDSAPAVEDLASPSSPARGTKEEGTSREVTEGAFQIRKSYSEHGRQAIVKSAGDAKAYKNAGTRFTENEPNWDNPFPLSYQGLRKVFLYLRLYDKWPREVIERMNGAAVTISGLVMPTAPVPPDGTMMSFWLANPIVVMAGCVFCSPPTLADLIYIEPAGGVKPLVVDREQLYTDTVPVTVTGRLFFGYWKAGEGTEALFRIEMRTWRIISR